MLHPEEQWLLTGALFGVEDWEALGKIGIECLSKQPKHLYNSFCNENMKIMPS